MGSMGSKGDRGKNGKARAGSSAVASAKAGYEYLLAYKITTPIYDYTVVFCKRYQHLLSSKRTYDQMVQAARSGSVNIAEGYMEKSLESYITLVGVNKASLEELLKDYHAFARQNGVSVLSKEETVRGVRELGVIWEILRSSPTLPDSPDFPYLPSDLSHSVNLLITLTNQAIYLQQKLLDSLERKFIEEGGFRENLFQKRLAYRKQK